MVGNHQALEIPAHYVDRLDEHGNNIIAYGIHLGMELQAGNPVADVDKAGTLVPGHLLFQILERRQKDKPWLDRKVPVILGCQIIEIELPGLSLVKRLLSHSRASPGPRSGSGIPPPSFSPQI